MAEELTEQKIQELRFLELVYSFQQLAMIALGKLANPATHQVERQLPQAKSLIDTLRMLKAKTQGNLNPTEQKLIDQIILTLELNYADEAARSARSTGGAGGADEVSKSSPETPPASNPPKTP